MKKVITSILLLTIVSCSDNKISQDKFKNAISEYLKNNLNDPASYEAVEWGKVDTLYSNSFEDTTHIKYIKELDYLQGHFNVFESEGKNHLIKGETEKAEKCLLEMKLTQNKRDSIHKLDSMFTSNYLPFKKGYSIQHKFRGKNKMGALVLQTVTFTCDTTYSDIKSFEK